MSRLLLDTHVVLWWLTGAALDADVHAMIQDPDNVVLVSVASAWEVAIGQSLGTLDPPEDFADAAVAEGLTVLGIELAHVRAVRNLPHHQRDPFDRLLVAQAARPGHPRRPSRAVRRRHPRGLTGRPAPTPAPTAERCAAAAVSYISWHNARVAHTITFRPDDDALRALSVLTQDGTSVSTAVRAALIAAAGTRAQERLRAEALALAADPADRAESAQVLKDMETLRAW